MWDGWPPLCVRQRDWGRMFTAGMLGGIAILASYAFAYLGTDAIWKVVAR